MDLAQIRKEYGKSKLSKKKVADNPLEQFDKWLQEAIAANVNEPTAMQISTVSPDNKPSCRTVLLKGVEAEKFVFYTNYDSRKGTHIAQNPHVSLTFFWPELERQVHIEGKATKIAPEQSDHYFQSRPWKSRVGARVSPQSQVISSRNEIITAFIAESARFIGQKVPRPEHWGGYAITPERIEFWQGQESRLHDRIVFILDEAANSWSKERLAP